MTTPYLIQRAKFIIPSEHTKTRKGIDKLLGFDYMGSAEFEFGALPKSLKRIRENRDKYTQFEYSFIKHPEKKVTVLCKKEEKSEVSEYLELLAIDKLRLKERCDLKNFVTGNQRNWDNDFWWDIDNDFMFWKPNPEFELEFKNELFPA